MNDLSINSLFGIAGKNVIVTGGSKGIGAMLSEAYVQAGCNVFVFSRKPDLEFTGKLNQMGPGTCQGLACDVADDKSIENAFEAVKAIQVFQQKGVHILVNNSGATWGSSFDETPKKSFDKLMNVNVTGLFMVCKVFMPLLEQAATPEDPARIINIASIDGHSVPAIEEYAYTASKAAVLHLTKNMAGNLISRNVLVNSISPGLFPSKMGDQVLKLGQELVNSAIPLGRPGKAKEIAAAAIFLSSPGGGYCSGADIVIDGGICVKPRL